MHVFVRRPVFIRPGRTCIFIFFQRHTRADCRIAAGTVVLIWSCLKWPQSWVWLKFVDRNQFRICLKETFFAVKRRIQSVGPRWSVPSFDSSRNSEPQQSSKTVDNFPCQPIVLKHRGANAKDPFIRTIWTWMEVFCQKKDEERMVLFWLHGVSSTLKVSIPMDHNLLRNEDPLPSFKSPGTCGLIIDQQE